MDASASPPSPVAGALVYVEYSKTIATLARAVEICTRVELFKADARGEVGIPLVAKNKLEPLAYKVGFFKASPAIDAQAHVLYLQPSRLGNPKERDANYRELASLTCDQAPTLQPVVEFLSAVVDGVRSEGRADDAETLRKLEFTLHANRVLAKGRKP